MGKLTHQIMLGIVAFIAGALIFGGIALIVDVADSNQSETPAQIITD